MSAVIAEYKVKAGVTNRIAMTLRDDDSVTPTNITGWTFASQIRDPRTDALLVQARVESRNDVQGQVTLVFDAADTETLETLEAVYDVIAVLPNGDRVDLLEGTANITARITAL
jgi:hypothetical protein